MRLRKKLEEHEDRLKELEQEEDDLDEESSCHSDEDKEPSVDLVESDKDSMLDYGEEDAKKDEDDNANEFGDPQLYDDMLRAKEDMRKKRAQFEGGLDPTLSADERAALLANYDAQMKEMEKNLQREQEQQEAQLKARLAARAKRAKKNTTGVEHTIKTNEQKIAELEEEVR